MAHMMPLSQRGIGACVNASALSLSSLSVKVIISSLYLNNPQAIYTGNPEYHLDLDDLAALELKRERFTGSERVGCINAVQRYSPGRQKTEGNNFLI